MRVIGAGLSRNVGKPGEVEPRNLLLVREHDDGFERQAVQQEVGQHDGRQPCLVAAWNAVEEHGPPVPAGEMVVDRVVVGVRNVGRKVVRIDIVLVQHCEQQAPQILVERGRRPVTAQECQVVDPGQCLTEPEERGRHLIRRCLQGEDAVLFVDAALANNLLAQRGTCALVEGIDVMLVADMHQRVAAVAQPDAAARRFGEIDGIVVSVRERERRFQHEHVVVTPVNADVGAQPLAQQPFQLHVVKGHRTSPARQAVRSNSGRRNLQPGGRASSPLACGRVWPWPRGGVARVGDHGDFRCSASRVRAPWPVKQGGRSVRARHADPFSPERTDVGAATVVERPVPNSALDLSRGSGNDSPRRL